MSKTNNNFEAENRLADAIIFYCKFTFKSIGSGLINFFKTHRYLHAIFLGIFFGSFILTLWPIHLIGLSYFFENRFILKIIHTIYESNPIKLFLYQWCFGMYIYLTLVGSYYIKYISKYQVKMSHVDLKRNDGIRPQVYKVTNPRPQDTLLQVRNMGICLLYTSPSPRDQRGSRMPSSA